MIAQLNKEYIKKSVIPKSVINETLIPNSIADREGKWPELRIAVCLAALFKPIGIKISSHTVHEDIIQISLSCLPKAGCFCWFNSQLQDRLGRL